MVNNQIQSYLSPYCLPICLFLKTDMVHGTILEHSPYLDVIVKDIKSLKVVQVGNHCRKT